jgi:hypothetical protein
MASTSRRNGRPSRRFRRPWRRLMNRRVTAEPRNRGTSKSLAYPTLPELSSPSRLRFDQMRTSAQRSLFRPKWCSEQTAVSVVCSIRIDQWLPSPRPSGSHRSTALALATPVAGANCFFRYLGIDSRALQIFFARPSRPARSVQHSIRRGGGRSFSAVARLSVAERNFLRLRRSISSEAMWITKGAATLPKAPNCTPYLRS